MPNYLRSRVPGGTYAFTVVSNQRRPILCDAMVRTALREGNQRTRVDLPFVIDGWVLMPNHMHCIWTLPDGDADFGKRWSMIKRHVSQQCHKAYSAQIETNASRQRRHESAIWQRRFWEHTVRDDVDYARCMDYLHFNPVKHRLVRCAADWPWSSFHRLVSEGVYTRDWGDGINESGGGFGE